METMLPRFSKRLLCNLVISVFFLVFYLVYKQIIYENQMTVNGENIVPERRKNYLLDEIDLECDDLYANNTSSLKHLESWKYIPDPVEKAILKSENRCALIKELFEFREKPLSKEEEDFPLAYGLIVHKNIVQVLFMMSSFYHPQNEYCIAVSGSSKLLFKHLMKQFGDCFPNIHILERPPISWGSFEIINSTYACFEYLTSLGNNWKYYQYLSGVDIPLKTNLEMVKIFKTLDGAPNFEILEFQKSRLRGKNISDSPLPLFKSSLSAVIPRSLANSITKSRVTGELLKFLNGTKVADESFWATVTENVEKFPIPGALDAQNFMDFRKNLSSMHSSGTSLARHKPIYYISRYQVWAGEGDCRGKFVSSSCVYGVKDFAKLVKQPHLVAHKFYLDYQPAAYFCALKEIRQRSLNPVPFDAKFYSELPQTELSKGVSLENLTHPDWLIHS